MACTDKNKECLTIDCLQSYCEDINIESFFQEETVKIDGKDIPIADSLVVPVAPNIVEEHKDENGNTIKNVDYILNKADELYKQRYKLISEELTNQWEADRITGNELATALLQASIQLSSSSLSDLINADNQSAALAERDYQLKLKELEAKQNQIIFKHKVKQDRANTILSLFKLSESLARIELQTEQAKGFRDQTKLNSIKLIFNSWATAFSQNQTEGIPNFIKNDNIEDVIDDWFVSIGLNNPNVDSDDASDEKLSS